MKPLILITNDDGYQSQGLRHLVEVASAFGDIVVMAPERNSSGLSTSITTSRPLRVRSVEMVGGSGYACDGTPVDCVKMGVEHFCPRRPDLVLSGINYGSNASINVIYSGTIGAVLEACLCGADQIKGIRVCRQAKAAWVDSLERRTDPIGRPYWWMTGKFVCDNPPHDTDQYFLSQGYVSVVPIRPDFTDTQALQNIQYFEK